MPDGLQPIQVTGMPQVQVEQGPPQPQLSGQTATVFNPQGELGDIPVEQIREAMAAGYDQAIPVIKKDTGELGHIPSKQLQDALNSGQYDVDTPEARAMHRGGVIGATTGLATGAAKGAIETMTSLLTGVGGEQAAEKIAPALTHVDTRPTGLAETIGMGAESIAEFVMGDEALKGLSLAEKFGIASKIAQMGEKYPSIAKALNIGMNAARMGTVGAAQAAVKGATPGEAALTGAVTAVTGGAGESTLAALTELRTAITAGRPIEELAAEYSGKLEQLATEMGGTQGPRAVAETVAEQLDAADDAMSERYDIGLKQVGQRAKDLQLTFGLQGSPLQKAAQDLLSDPRVPVEFQGRPAPEIERLAPQLEGFAKPTRTYSWDELEATRRMLGQQIRSLPWNNPAKAYLVTMRDAMDETMARAAETSGDARIDIDMKAVRSEYADKINKFKTTAIRTLADKNPNAVASVLLNKSSVTNLANLRGLIGDQNMQAVEGSILRDLTTRSTNPDGTLNLQRVIGNWNRMGNDVRTAVWGDNAPKIQTIMDEMQKAFDASSDKTAIMKRVTNEIGRLGHASMWIGLYGLLHGDLKQAYEAGSGIAVVSALTNPAIVDKLAVVLRPLIPISAGATAGLATAAQTGSRTVFRMPDGSYHSVPSESIDMVRQKFPDAQIIEAPQQ